MAHGSTVSVLYNVDMIFQANVLKVMIASPGDVLTERDIVTEEIYRWNAANGVSRELILQPVRWETHGSPQMGAHPQEILNEHLLLDADIVVGIFGTRIGTATAEFVSGSVEEIKKHVAAGKLAMLYFSHVPVNPNFIDQKQWELLQNFKEECKSGGLYAEYDSHERLRNNFSHHLAIELNKAKYKWITRPVTNIEVSDPALDGNEVRLLLAAAGDRNGQILASADMQGFHVQTNGRNFVENSPRSEAMWKRVLRNLTEIGYLGEVGKEIYELTDEGFARADKEQAKLPLELSVSVQGPADNQKLALHSNKRVTLEKIEFLTSSEVRISSMELGEQINVDADVALDHKRVVELFNAPRPDRSNWDLSGPAALRLSLASDGHRFETVLPILLQPKLIGNTQWIEVVGSKSFSLK